MHYWFVSPWSSTFIINKLAISKSILTKQKLTLQLYPILSWDGTDMRYMDPISSIRAKSSVLFTNWTSYIFLTSSKSSRIKFLFILMF